MQVAIIGCGYVGSTLGAALVRAGHDVTGTTTRNERRPELEALGLRPVVLELAQPQILASVVAGSDTVIVTVAPGDESSHRQVYLEGMRHLLAALPGTKVRHVLYTSSTSVYGQRDGSWVDEDSPTWPVGENGRILVQTEQELLEGTGRLGIQSTILRLAGIIGPGRGPARRIPAYAGLERTDGEGFINLICRDDIVEVCLRLVHKPRAGILNVSDGRPVRRREYYDAILSALGLPGIQWAEPAGTPDLGKRVCSQRVIDLLGIRMVDAVAASLTDTRTAQGDNQS